MQKQNYKICPFMEVAFRKYLNLLKYSKRMIRKVMVLKEE